MPLIREHARQTPVVSALFVAATGGELNTVIDLINADATQNIYATNANEEALLVDVIRAGKPQIAQHLFGTYEADLQTVKTFFESQRLDDDATWRGQQILVACGDKLCDAVAQTVTDSMRLPRVGAEQRHGLIVLLKRNNHSVADVLWLSPQKHANAAHDDRGIAKIVELIYAENGGGVLDIMLQMDNNLLALAAQHRQPELFFRMQPHFGNAFEWIDYMPMLCRLASVDETHKDSIAALKALVDRLAMFELDDLCGLENAWRLLETPMKLQKLDMFEYILNEMCRIRSCPAKDILEELFHKSHLLSFEDIYRRKNLNFAPFIYKWIECDGDLWLRHISDWTPLTHLCVHHEHTSIADDVLADVIIANSDRLDARVRYDFADKLIVQQRLPVLRRWFDECPAVAVQLYNAGNGFYCHVYDNISGINGGRIEMAEFLFESCAPLWSERSLMNFILNCSDRPCAIGLLRKLLAAPQSKDVAADWSEWGDNRSPLFTALMTRCPLNYQVLFDSVRDTTAIASMTEYNNDSILAAAIWSPFDSRDIFKFRGYSQAVDDDGFPLPPEDLSRPEEECVIERAQYEEIFSKLVDIGCDIHQLNDDRQSLLHFAVIHDNVPVLRSLLDAGLDPCIGDKTGTLPIHLVSSVDAFHTLLNAAEQPQVLMSQRNDAGETPFSCFVRHVCTDSLSMADSRRAKTMELLDVMRSSVGDVSDALTNSRNGSTPLHCWSVNAEMTNWLLSNGVDINAVESESGETALHRQIQSGHLNDVSEMMLASPNLNWHAISASGLSYLSLLVNLSEEQFERIRPIVRLRQNDVDRLFAEQCNSKDSSGIPLLHTAIRSDTNAYCLRRLLEHKDRMCLDSVVRAGVRDPAALKIAPDLCMDRPSDLMANLRSDTLAHALGYPAIQTMGPCPESVRALIKAGISVNSPCDMTGLKPVPNVLRHLCKNGYGDKRKAVVTVAASLIAAGADYTETTEQRNSLRETVLRCLLED